MGPIYEAYFPDECAYNTSISTSTRTAPALELLAVNNTTDCEKEENLALGWALTVASISVVLSLFGAVIAGILDKRRSKVLGHDLEEQPKVQAPPRAPGADFPKKNEVLRM